MLRITVTDSTASSKEMKLEGRVTGAAVPELRRLCEASGVSGDEAAVRAIVEKELTGKAADIRPLLAKYGAWQEKKISDPGF